MKSLMLSIVLSAIPLFASAGDYKAVETEVLGLGKAFNDAYANNEVDTYFSFYAKDVTLYYFGERQSLGEYNKEWHEMVAAGGGVVRNDISDVQVQVLPGGDAAVATYFVDNQTRSADGEVTAAKAFETDVWQKAHGEWKIISLHYCEITAE
jgi:ketosteroid isomerase-like protein